MKVYVLNYMLIIDGCCAENETHIYSSQESGKELFDQLVAEDKEDNCKLGWSEDESELANNYFESWDDDCYAMNHCVISLKEYEVE